VLPTPRTATILAAEHEKQRRRLEDIGQLAAFAEKYETLTDFLAEAMLYEGTRRGQNSDGRRSDRLVFIHNPSGKGLEWTRCLSLIWLTAPFRISGQPRRGFWKRRGGCFTLPSPVLSGIFFFDLSGTGAAGRFGLERAVNVFCGRLMKIYLLRPMGWSGSIRIKKPLTRLNILMK